MAKKNKFTLSVMERLEQEAKIKKAETSSPQSTPSTPTEAKQESSASVETKAEPAPQTVAVKEETPPIPTDLSQFLRPQSRREAKNKTFYLDTAVIAAIRVAAKKQNMAESRLVNEILASVLGVSLED